MRKSRLMTLCGAVGFFVVLACGCSSSATAPPPSGPHLYAAESSANQVAVLKLALTMTSMPAFNIGGFTSNTGVAFDSAKNLYVSNTVAGSVAVFNPPYSSTSAPVFTIAGAASTLVHPEQIGFDSSGNLWVADQISTVLEFTPPFGAASAPALTVSNSVNSAQGVAFDASRNLYVADGNAALEVFAPPYASAPVKNTTGLQFPSAVVTDAANAYVADFSAKGVVVFSLPVTAVAAPAFTITSGLGNGPQGLTFDGSGNLYVSTNAGEIVIFVPPFSVTSTPALTVSCFESPASCLTRQMAFGP